MMLNLLTGVPCARTMDRTRLMFLLEEWEGGRERQTRGREVREERKVR